MQLLLPPSETKRDGGAAGSALDLDLLGFPGLTAPRRRMLAAIRSLAQNRKTMAAALKLGPTQLFEIDRNRALRHSALLPAIDRYTGVLYDALGADSLSASARVFAAEHVTIQSALFGLLRAGDPIPAYRLSHDSRLPGLPLGAAWRDPIARELGELPGLVLDLRSEAYVALGPAPRGSWFLRVVTEDADGTRRALNHFNKKGKGEFTRAILEEGVDHGSVDSLLEWSASRGIRLSRGEGSELFLCV